LLAGEGRLHLRRGESNTLRRDPTISAAHQNPLPKSDYKRMTPSTANGKRLIRVTKGNLAHHHIYIREHYDFFPPDCIGPARRNGAINGHSIQLLLAGLDKPVTTDIAASAKTGKPRGFLRCRKEIGRFLKANQVGEGDLLALERLGTREYRLSLARKSSGNGHSFTAAEFFAGIGLVRLALEKHDWHVLFANDIDPAKAEMYRHNWPNDDHLVVEDIHKLNADDIPTCDLFTASFPCNDLSIAGR
jgi:C-5 cytosine-specific DNA methylase